MKALQLLLFTLTAVYYYCFTFTAVKLLLRFFCFYFLSGGCPSSGQDHLQRMVRGQGGVQGINRAPVGPHRVRPRLHRLRQHLG